jgi:hypothetical protein
MAFVIVIALFLIYEFYWKERNMVVVELEGYSYKVYGNYDDCYHAAVILHRCNKFLMEFMRHLRRKYTIHEAGRARESAARILLNYNPERLIESVASGKDTAYTINKGERMHMCVRSADDGSLHDLELCKFVMLHELAHIANEKWGHGPDYWETFKWVLHVAYTSGIYTPVDYKRAPQRWCSLNVNYNPYFDPSVREIY